MTKMPIKTPPRAALTTRRQSGIALLEILGALAVGAILVLSLSSAMDTSLEDMKGQQASYYQSQVAVAAQKYMAANNASLRSSLPTPGALVAVGVPQLVAGKFLPGGTSLRNVYGQTPCVLIRQPDPSLKPGQFDALVATSRGDPIPEKVIAVIAANAGPGGGYISSSDTGNAKGATWSSSTAAFRGTACSGGNALTGGAADGGRLASNVFFDGPGQSSTDFLYRDDVTGHPELNQMNTPIRMASAALVSAGSTCQDSAGNPVAGLAIDAATRGLLVCGGGGVWTSPTQWKDPVPSYSNLPLAGNASGDVRMVKDLARAFTFNGTSWKALAVDQDDNMEVPGTLNATNVHSRQNMTADGTITAVGDISTSGSVTANVDVIANRNLKGRDAYLSHNVVSEGLQVNRWTSSPAFTVGIHDFVPGQACHYPVFDPYEGFSHIVYPMGTVVMDANFRPLICGADHTMRYANGTYSP